MSRFQSALFSALVLLLAVGCGGSGADPDSGPDPVDPVPGSRKVSLGDVTPEPFQSCADFRSYVVDALHLELTEPRPCTVCLFASPPAASLPTAPPPPADSSVLTVSQTNTREAGVDEMDVIETASDGTFYILRNNDLHVTQGLPPAGLNAGLIVPLTDEDDDTNIYSMGLLLDESNQRLAVVQFVVSHQSNGASFLNYRVYSRLAIFDVSSADTPVLDRVVELDGLVLDARRIGSRLHLFTSIDIPYPAGFFSPEVHLLYSEFRDASNSGDEALAAQRSAQIRDALAAAFLDSGVDHLLPGADVTNADGSTQSLRLGCTELAAPRIRVSPAITMVTSLDTNGDNLAAAAVVNSNHYVYASTEAAYLVQAGYNWWFDPAQADESSVYKFAIGDGAPEYRAAGIFDGHIYDTLALSEHNGALRVAATQDVYRPASEDFQRQNHLFVLQDDSAGTLRQSGAVRAFETDEDIFAVRYIGERGFVVTFRQIDPLFTFDLSDPANPRVVGELVMPGFSSYMQAISDRHLLTIGRDGTLAGQTGDISLRIFDVGDLASPQLLHSYNLETDGSPWAAWTPAAYDPRAFNYEPVSGILSLPFINLDLNGPDDSFAGFLYFSATPVGGISEIGRLSHLPAEASNCGAGFGYPVCFFPDPQRSVFIDVGGDQFIYTLSNMGMKVTRDNDPYTVLGEFEF